MSTFILVHGAWHGSWCWHKVIPLLEQEGHTAVALDMPGRAGDERPCSELTLDDYVGKITEAIGLQDEPVILVGHSMGGGSITQAAEICAERIRMLVYVAAAAPPDGMSMAASTTAHDIPLALYGPGRAELDEAAGCLMLSADAPLKEMFFGECDDDDIALARASVTVHEALAPTMQAVHLSAGRYGRVPKIYIECLRDQAIPIELQRAIYKPLNCEEIVTLDTDHSPFFSMPRALADALLECA